MLLILYVFNIVYCLYNILFTNIQLISIDKTKTKRKNASWFRETGNLKKKNHIITKNQKINVFMTFVWRFVMQELQIGFNETGHRQIHLWTHIVWKPYNFEKQYHFPESVNLDVLLWSHIQSRGVSQLTCFYGDKIQ